MHGLNHMHYMLLTIIRADGEMMVLEDWSEDDAGEVLPCACNSEIIFSTPQKKEKRHHHYHRR